MIRKDVKADEIVYVSDNSRGSLMQRCRQRALGLMVEQGYDPKGFEVWQHQGADRGHEFVGFMPGIPPNGGGGIYSVRPGDFRWGELDGKRVIVAAWNICPGDWACVPGFVRSDGTVPEKSEHARKFEQLSAFGGDRLTNIATIIRDALD